MHSEEKEVNYSHRNTYSTLNTFTESTKNVWLVFHGLGYLSRYFIRYFKDLNADENYIIAPQAPSKYYQDGNFKHVGASWLTKEQTVLETQNILSYIDAILKSELREDGDYRFVLLGYSQGVSIAMRYLASRKISCDELIIHSGGIPVELKPEDFKFFNGRVSLIYGLNDEYLTPKRICSEKAKAQLLFGESINIHPFEGVHEMNPELVAEIVGNELKR